MTVPAYTDVSHFRAPYKNAVFSGYGGWGGYGAAGDPAPAPAGAPEAAAAPLFTTDPDGIRVLTPTIAATVQLLLQGSSVVYIGPVNGDDVRFEATVPGDIRENAWAWCQKKLGEGKSILVGSTAGLPGIFMPPPVQKLLKAVKGKSGELDAAGPTALPLYAVLTRPAPGAAKALMLSGPLGIGLVASVIVVGIYYMQKKRKTAR